MSLDILFQEYGVHADASAEAEPMTRTLFAGRSVFPETKEALHILTEAGINCVIGSTTDNDSIQHFLSEWY